MWQRCQCDIFALMHISILQVHKVSMSTINKLLSPGLPLYLYFNTYLNNTGVLCTRLCLWQHGKIRWLTY